MTIINSMTRCSIDTGWRFVEIPCVDPGMRGNRARVGPDIRGSVQTIRAKERCGVFI
jgi:hypothetical protein